MTVLVTGVDEFRAALGVKAKRVMTEGETFVRRAGSLVASKAKKHFIPSSEAAAVDEWRSDAWPIPTRRSGALQASIRTTSVIESGGVWTSRTGPTTVYGRRIELGYTGVGRWPSFTTRPFPFLKPGLEDALPDISRLFEEIVIAAQEV